MRTIVRYTRRPQGIYGHQFGVSVPAQRLREWVFAARPRRNLKRTRERCKEPQSGVDRLPATVIRLVVRSTVSSLASRAT
jgi:hypothetical protein